MMFQMYLYYIIIYIYIHYNYIWNPPHFFPQNWNLCWQKPRPAAKEDWEEAPGEQEPNNCAWGPAV